MFKQVFRGPLSETATVASQLGTPGELRADSVGNIFQLFKVGSIAVQACAAVQLESTNGTNGYQVAPASIANHGAIGFANQVNSTATYAVGAYFWAQKYGVGSVNLTVTAAANIMLFASVSGKLTSAVAQSSHVGACARCLADVTGSVPALAFINCLQGF